MMHSTCCGTVMHDAIIWSHCSTERCWIIQRVLDYNKYSYTVCNCAHWVHYILRVLDYACSCRSHDRIYICIYIYIYIYIYVGQD